MGIIKKKTVAAIVAVFLAITFLPFLQLYTVKAAEGTPTVHYVDESGTELTVANGRDWESDTTTTPAFLIYDIDGYDYVKTTLESVSGNEIRPILRRNNSGVWQYTTSTGTSVSWTSLPEDQDVYVVYKKAPDPVKGGTPKVKESGTEDPVDPVIHKESISNGDGTNTIGLSITADTSPLEVEKLADVIVIFDTSSSMRRKMGTSTTTYYDNDTPASEQAGEQTRLYLASQAVDKLADLLIGENTAFKDSAGNKLIRMSLISFDRDAVEQIGFTDNVNNYKAKVDALTTNQGTNWEAALDKANYMAVDPERATFVIFVTDGNPSYRLDRGNTLTLEGYPGTVDDAHVDVYADNTYYVYRAFQYFGALRESDARNYNTAAVDAKSIVDNNKILFSIGIGNAAGVSRLTGLTSAAYNSEDIGKERTKTAENEEELTQAFSDIAASIVALLGWGDIQMTDGITSLANTVEKSGLVQVDGKFEYWKAPAPEGWDEMDKDQRREFLETYQPDKDAFEKWDPSKEGCQEAVYDSASGSVKWDMGHNFVPESGCTYKVTFRVWPSQEAYDILANLKNGTVTYDSLPAAQKAQIVDHGNGSYSLKTNDKAPNTTYKAARKTNDGVTTSGDTQTLMFNDVDPMALVPEKMTVKKEWDHDMNMSHAADALKFHLLVDGKYYQKDGSFDSDPANALVLDISEEEREKADGTKIPAWSNSVNIAPGIVIFDGTGDSKKAEVYETGHKYQLEEFGMTLDGEPVEAFDGSYEFTTQTVRPMVLTDAENNYHADLIYLILADDDNPVPEGAKTYTIDGETYYIAEENNSTVVGTNHRKAELDITKLIINNSEDPSFTEEKLNNETFTYRVTLNVPEDADLSQMTAYEFVKRTDGELFYIDGYKEGENPLQGDETRFSEKTYRWYTVKYPNTDKLADSFTTEGAGDGRKQLVIDVTLKRDEVLRFTNVPTDTRYTITEVYANYRTANPSRDVDAPGSDAPGNLAEQGYSVTQILSSADEYEVDGSTITGTITEPNRRYYNQFTNTLGNVVEVKLDGVKHLDGYSWSGERYYFNLSSEEGTPMPGASGRTRFYLSNASGTDDRSYSFGTIRFVKEGDYIYTIAEDDAGTKTMVNGKLITFGGEEKVTIKIAKNADGLLYVESVEGTNTKWNANTSTATTTITNKYELTDVSIYKIWVDNNGQFGRRVAAGEFAGYLKLLANGTEVTDVTPTVTVDETDSNKYIITWVGLPKTSDDGAITYTVQESAITGYVTSYGQDGATFAENGGTITNTYQATGQATLEATKVLEGAEWPKGKTLTFTLAGEGGTLPTDKTATLSAPGTVTFDAITYDLSDIGQKYTYTITEDGFGKGWKGTPDNITATVVVSDNRDGTLGTDVTYSPENATFTNSYDYKGTEAILQVKKTLVVPEGFKGPKDISEAFTFTLSAKTENAPMPEGTGNVVKNPDSDGGLASFGKIGYSKPGIYEYKIVESDGNVPGVINDKSEQFVTVTIVEDESKGELKVDSIKYSNEKAYAEFVNTYKVEPATASFPVKKILSVPAGLDGPKSWSYDIAVKADKEGTPVAETMTGTVTKEKDTVTFGPFTYDAPGTYTYTVSETGTVKGVTNDKDAAGKKVTVEVVDNGNGTLTATPSVTEESPLTFTNTYAAGTVEAEIPVEKILSVPEGRTAPDITGKFTFKLKAGTNTAKVEGTETPMPKTTELTNPDADGGKMAFGKIEYKLPGEYTYTVTESGKVIGVVNDAQAEKTVKVTVTDNGDGTLSAAVNGGKPLQFTNDYKVVDLIIEKDISTYQHMEGEERSATIIFRVTATMDGWENPVYDNYFSVTMTGADTQQIKLEGLIPEGADVTIEETYTGAGFDAAEGSKTKQEILDIKGTEAVKVSFENEFMDQNKGHGIENRYEYKDSKWQKPIQNSN